MHIPGLVVIDDHKDELDQIVTAFTNAGIACLPILFEKNSVENPSGIDHIEVDNFDIRVIVTDLNLRYAHNTEPQQLSEPIIALLEKLNIQNNYAIYFWSKHHEQVAEVMDLIYERCKGAFNLPLEWGVIKKSEFKDRPPTELKEKVKSFLLETQVFNALFDWENRIYKAASSTTGALFNLTSNTEEHETRIEQLKNIIARIGNESVGQKNAIENKSLSVDLGLAPVLNDQLQMISSGDGYWSDAIPGIGKKADLDEHAKAVLNSFYHIQNVNPDYPKDCKGVFIRLSDDILRDSNKKTKIEKKLGREIDTLLHDEFISRNNFRDIEKNEFNEYLSNIKENTILGFIETSADCDQAQKKTKLNRYLLCALIPAKYYENTCFRFGEVTKETAHEGIYKTPQLLIGDDKYILKVSFKYQIGTIPTSNVHGEEYINTWLGVPMFRLREQILSDITFKCSQYSTRPGIISFY